MVAGRQEQCEETIRVGSTAADAGTLATRTVSPCPHHETFTHGAIQHVCIAELV